MTRIFVFSTVFSLMFLSFQNYKQEPLFTSSESAIVHNVLLASRSSFANSFTVNKRAKGKTIKAVERQKTVPNSTPSNCPASPYPITIKQADGTSLTIVGKGNKFSPWTETTDGYSIVRTNGIYEFAKRVNGKLTSSGIRANNLGNRTEKEDKWLLTTPKSLKPITSVIPGFKKKYSHSTSSLQDASFPSTGTRKTLLILIKYPDLNNTYTHANFTNFMNQPGYNGTGSFRDFFLSSSFGKLNLTTDVFGWYTAVNKHAYYGEQSGETRSTLLVREAVNAAEAAGVDFSQYDNDKDGVVDGVIIAHSGPGSEEGGQLQYIWSHRSTLSSGNNQVTYDGVLINDYIINPETRLSNSAMVGIGVFCHEFGHNMGLPDLYDISELSEGVGNWCLMGSGAWLGSERTPGNMSAWCRMALGWLQPKVITTTGNYTLNSSSGNAECYRINTPLLNEYFLLENRQKTGLDVSLKGSGLAVWHINTNKTSLINNDVNADKNLKGVDMEEADGRNDMDYNFNQGDAGDLFPGTSNNKSFNDFTGPNSNTYTNAKTGINVKNITIDANGKASFAFEDAKTTPPIITSFLPTTASPGHAVTITGSNLTYVTAVSFGGTNAASFTINSPNSITAIVGIGGSGNVVLTSPIGTISATGFTFILPPPPPIISSINPASGTIGSSITITGSNFNANAASNSVYFGGVKSTVTAASATSLTVTVPVGADYSPLTVTTGGLSGYSPKPFIVTFSGASPAFASTIFAAKSELKIENGTNYNPRGVITVDIDNDKKLELVVFGGLSNILIYKNTGDPKQPYGITPTLILETTSSQYVVTGDFDGDGKIDLAANSYTKNSISIFKNTSNGSISFAGKVDITSVLNTLQIKAGDLDGDGKPDLVVAGAHSTNFVYVLRNTESAGSISFSSPMQFTTGTTPTHVAIGDITNDGKPDLISANYNGGSISVFKNTGSSGTISFSAKVDFTIGGLPSSVVMGDFDGDDKLDLAVGNVGFKHTGFPGESISILKNTTTGGSVSFGSPQEFSATPKPSDIIISDVDGDGKPDLAVYHQNYSTAIALYKNTTNGGPINFAPKVDFRIGNEPTSFTFSDWNGDGKPDLAISTAFPSVVTLLRNRMNEPVLSSFKIVTGDPNYNVELSGTSLTGSTVAKFGNISATSFIVASDILIKALVPANTAGTISITNPHGTGTLDNFSNIPSPVITSISPTKSKIGSTVIISGSNFSALSAANIVYFGAVKAIVSAASNTSISVIVPAGATNAPIRVTSNALTAASPQTFSVTYPGGEKAFSLTSFSPKTELTSGSAKDALASADFNGDGKPDLAVYNSASAKIKIFKNSGLPVPFSATPDLQITEDCRYLTISDIDGDGKQDIVVGMYQYSGITVHRNTSTAGTISFAPKELFLIGSLLSAYAVEVEDLDLDGKPDLAVANDSSDGNISIFRNLSSPGIIAFSERMNFTAGTNPRGIALRDLDGDGKFDVVVANYNSNTVSVFKNNSLPGTISLLPKVDFATGTNPTGIAVTDLDNDGKHDLAVTNQNSNTVSILKNTSTIGTISFSPKVDFSVMEFPQNISASDLNGDGMPDLAILNYYGGNLSILKNTSTSQISFAAKVNYTLESYPSSISIADWTGDGKPDLAIASQTKINLLINRTTGPTLTSYQLTTGNVATNVTLIGTNLTGATSLTFGSTPATSFTVVSETSITALVPVGTSGAISVTTPDGTTDLTGFSNFTAPVISSFTPLSACSGTTLTITGTNFTGTTSVSFGGIAAASFKVVSSTTITAVCASTSLSGNVSVSHQGGTSTIAGFIFLPVPVIAASGATTFLSGGSVILQVNNTYATYKWFKNGIEIPNATGKSYTATEGGSYTANPGISSCGSNAILVTVQNLPVIVSFTPTSASSGSIVTITGTYFTGATAVRIGGTTANSFIVNSPTSITAVVGNGASGNISVVTPSGTATLAGFTFVPKPVIASFSPSAAIIGTSITINGTNFTGATAVSFGGIAATSFTVISPVKITAVVGAGASGNVSVTTALGTGTATNFTFVPFPTIRANGPTTFSTGGTVELSSSPGSNFQWRKDGVDISGAHHPFYNVRESGVYTASVTHGGITQISAPIVVNVVFSLPVTNFNVSAFSATCRNSNNGIVKITAAQNLGYTATITGSNGVSTLYPFTSTVSIDNLAAGTYNVCITVAGQPHYRQCFTTVVTEPQDLTVYISVSKLDNRAVLYLSGADVYNVSFNGANYTTRDSRLSLPLANGNNNIVVTSDKVCQGAVEEQIVLSNDYLVYPNPVERLLNLDLGIKNIQNALIKIYGTDGRLVYSTGYTNQSGVIQLDLSDLKTDVYVLQLSVGNIIKTFKIVKL